MPYISPERRKELDDGAWPRTPGELNYNLTKVATNYLEDRTLYYPHHDISYTDLNDIIGAFESAKQEFYRRVVVPFEDKKRATNGDVY